MGGGPNEYEDDFENDSSSGKKTAAPAAGAPQQTLQIAGPAVPIPSAPGNASQPPTSQYQQQLPQPITTLGLPQANVQQPVSHSTSMPQVQQQPLQQPQAPLGMPQAPPVGQPHQHQPGLPAQQPQPSSQIMPLGASQNPTSAAPQTPLYHYPSYVPQPSLPIEALGVHQQPQVSSTAAATATMPQYQQPPPPTDATQQQYPPVALGMLQLPPVGQPSQYPLPYVQMQPQPSACDAAASGQTLSAGPPTAAPTAQSIAVAQPASEELKSYVVASSGGNLRFRFAGVEMIRRERRKPQDTPPSKVGQQASARRGYAAREVRVWQTFREQPSTDADANVRTAHGVLVVVPTHQADEIPAMRTYDESHGGVDASFTSDDLFTAAFAHPPEALAKAVQRLKDEASHLPTEELRHHRFIDALNQTGNVAYHHRLLGVKKVKESFVLGLGGKATALQFAVLSGRLDNVLMLIQAGGATLDNITMAKRIATANSFAAIEELLNTVKGAKQKKGKKATSTANPQPKQAVPDPA